MVSIPYRDITTSLDPTTDHKWGVVSIPYRDITTDMDEEEIFGEMLFQSLIGT